MRWLFLTLGLCIVLVSTGMAFETLDIPEEAVKIDAMHPVPELLAFSLVESQEMACMKELFIQQCLRKVYSDESQRLFLVFLENAPTYYWYYDPESKVASATPFPSAPGGPGFFARDPERPQAGAENRGDFFQNSNKQRGGNVRFFDF